MNLEFKLQAWTIAINSLKMAWRNKKVFFNTISLPSLLLVLCYALGLEYAKNSGFPVIIIIMGTLGIGLSWLIIICHRLVLVSGFNVYKELDFRMAVRSINLLVMIFQVFLVMWIIEAVVMIFILYILHSYFESNEIKDIIYWIKSFSQALSVYALGRLSLVFPAIAVDKKASLKWSWIITRGNGWNMFVIVGLFPLCFFVMINFLWRENATVIENAILLIASFLVYAIEIFALSLTYREFESYYVVDKKAL